MTAQMGERAGGGRSCPLDLRADELTQEAGDILDRTGGLRIADLLREPSLPFLIWGDNGPREKLLTGCDRALDVKRIHDKLRNVIGLHPSWQKRYAPCLKCGKTTLGNWIGDDDIKCQECDWSIDIDIYQEYCSEILERGRPGD